MFVVMCKIGNIFAVKHNIIKNMAAWIGLSEVSLFLSLIEPEAVWKCEVTPTSSLNVSCYVSEPPNCFVLCAYTRQKTLTPFTFDGMLKFLFIRQVRIHFSLVL